MELTNEHDHSDHPEGELSCVWCGRDYPFELPEAVLSAAKRGKLIVFAGAGISTENSTVYPTSLYTEFKAQLDIEGADPSFPELMTAYESAFGRPALIAEVVQRFDYVSSFPAIEKFATRFHRELATIGNIQTIITTNWDTAFEEHCLARPFVVDDDYAYYDLPGRKVFKIHGSINNVSSIVATSDDYSSREQSFSTSAMGSTLKHLLATETTVFVGFSLTDPDFQSIYRALLKGLGRARPPAYVVDPFGNDLAEDLGLKIIKTDGTNFLRELKRSLVSEDVLLSDTVLRRTRALEAAALQAQNQILSGDWRTQPALMFSIAYLDGIQDCSGRSLVRAKSGESTLAHHLSHLVRDYDELLQIAVSRERWWDAAYIHGYLNTLISLFVKDAEFCSIELFEAFDSSDYPGVVEDIDTDDASSDGVDGDLLGSTLTDPLDWNGDFLDALFDELDIEEILERYAQSACASKPSIEAEHRNLVGRLPDGMLFRHTPFLDGVLPDAPAHPHL